MTSDFRPTQAPAHRRPTIVEREPGKWPSLDAFLAAFGTFSAALAYAGLEPARRGPPVQWPPDLILEAIRRDAFQRGRATVSTDWPHAIPGERPSVGTVIRAFGSFPAAVQAALASQPELRPAEDPYKQLADLRPWLLRRGIDFEPEVTIQTVRERVRRWARRNGFSRERGYTVNTAVVNLDPDTGRSYRDLQGATKRDTSTKPEYGLAVQIERDKAESKRR